MELKNIYLVQTIFGIIASILAGYLLVLLVVFMMQSKLFYYPKKDIWATPEDVGLQYENVIFNTEDNISLNGWFVPSEQAELTVLFFHGNAGNISDRLQTIQMLNELDLNVFIFDYRGYGQSEGYPTEQGTYKDGLAAWNYLTAKRGIADSSIVIMGRSLGGSIASWLSARQHPAAAVIESTFTSAADIGSDLYPWLPVRWMIKYEYNTIGYLKQIDSPLFMAHSRGDQIVPFHHGQKLFEAANEPKVFVELVGLHSSGYLETGEKYREGLQQFLAKNTLYQQQVTSR